MMNMLARRRCGDEVGKLLSKRSRDMRWQRGKVLPSIDCRWGFNCSDRSGFDVLSDSTLAYVGRGTILVKHAEREMSGCRSVSVCRDSDAERQMSSILLSSGTPTAYRYLGQSSFPIKARTWTFDNRKKQDGKNNCTQKLSSPFFHATAR
jgi:hypothetical protein